MDQHIPSLDWLLTRFFNGSASASEKEQLFKYLQQPENDAILKEWISRVNPDTLDPQSFPEGTADAMLQAIFQAGSSKDAAMEEKTELKKVIPIRRWIAAASILVMVAAVAWWLLVQKTGNPDQTLAANETNTEKKADPVPPGSDKAILELDNGNTIRLDSKGNSEVDIEFGSSIERTKAMLDYSAIHQDPNSRKQFPEGAPVTRHKLSTPKGGQYQLTLPDGSKVWLNAASSIRFPTSFGDTRKISIEGEVYIEVAPDKNKPFIVQTNEAEIQVLGTIFNINAYENEEASAITLVNGSVKVLRGASPESNVVLDPGQQAILFPAQQRKPIQVKQVDVQQQIAWKNGLFSFKSTDIASMMRQMERWYDMEAVYPKGMPADRFSGSFPRSVNLDQFLEILRYSDIKATVEGKSVIIKP
ncbi:MAG: FecR domain-containing protein [Chitinophagaceae bacterium]|nr:FecR domain-containing protein [Chitinophagaceae bacterium]